MVIVRCFRLRNNTQTMYLELNLNGAGGNGLEYLAALQKIQFRHRPCIVVTTNNTSQIILSTARKYGADIILTKYQEDQTKDRMGETVQNLGIWIPEPANAGPGLACPALN